jgi:hypothetical protein
MYDEATLREVKRRLVDRSEGRTEAYEATLAWINVQLASMKRVTEHQEPAPRVPKRWDIYDV